MHYRQQFALFLAPLALNSCESGATGSSTTGSAAPAITAISPDAGLTAGGTTVTMTGSNFKAGMTVNFGPVPSKTVTVISPTTLTAISPAGSSTGKVNIVVASGSETSLTSAASQFGYLAFAEFTVPTAKSRPSGITAGPDGNLWFTELGANSIGRVSLSGVVTEYPVPTADSEPRESATGPDGNLWFTEGTVTRSEK